MGFLSSHYLLKMVAASIYLSTAYLKVHVCNESHKGEQRVRSMVPVQLMAYIGRAMIAT